VTEWLADALNEYAKAHTEGYSDYTTGDFELVTGHAAMPYSQFARDFAQVFRGGRVTAQDIPLPGWGASHLQHNPYTRAAEPRGLSEIDDVALTRVLSAYLGHASPDLKQLKRVVRREPHRHPVRTSDCERVQPPWLVALVHRTLELVGRRHLRWVWTCVASIERANPDDSIGNDHAISPT